MYDLVIHGGRVIDGAGNPPLPMDVGVSDGRIAYLGRLAPRDGAKAVDASGMVVTPGFIDLHSHSDLAVLQDPELRPKVAQGITTEVVGQDGVGVAPVTEWMVDVQKSLMSGWVYPEALEVEWTWRSVSDYLDYIDQLRPSINVATLVPHGNLRRHVVDMSQDQLSAEQATQMKALLADGLRDGGLGFSTGLIYLPCAFADENELREMCSVCGEFGALFDVHLRQYGGLFLDSVDEVLRVAEATGARLHLCHYNVAGEQNWWQLEESFTRIAEARMRNVWVTGDQHSYPAASTSLGAAALPPRITRQPAAEALASLADPETRRSLVDMIEGRVESDFDNWIRYGGFSGVIVGAVSAPENRFVQGLTLYEIAERKRQSPGEATLRLIEEDVKSSGSLFSVSVIVFWSNDDVCGRIMRDPYFGFGTDALLIAGHPHPRCFGTFPRILSTFWRDRDEVSLPEAVRKMTGLAAEVAGITNRGLLRPGYHADVVVFDPEEVRDLATYREPARPPEGIAWVINNGHIVIQDGEHTGARPGRAIRRDWSR